MAFLFTTNKHIRGGDHEHTSIHSSLKENKISRNKHNQGYEGPSTIKTLNFKRKISYAHGWTELTL